MTTAQAQITVLPEVGQAVKIYMTLIFAVTNVLEEATITATSVVYGNVIFTQPNIFIPMDNNPLAILVLGIYNSIEYSDILYTKAVMPDILPDNFKLLVQKYPEGVFNDGIVSATLVNGFSQNDGNVIGWDTKARSQMIDDYYTQYFFTKGQVFSTNYSQQLEYEYNGTVGLLSNSSYPDELFQLLATLPTVRLNSYDLELFVSKYIYYRIHRICAVYIDDHIDPPGLYWQINVSTLNVNTTIAPNNYQPSIKNLFWIIFNTVGFLQSFMDEIIALIHRISRADIGNTIEFNIYDIETDLQFTFVGPTYQNDPRLIYDKALQFIGDNVFPLNIIGYIRNAEPEIVQPLGALISGNRYDIAVDTPDPDNLLLTKINN